jgi:uncharacterized membrane protein YhiD involved in acid resistance
MDWESLIIGTVNIDIWQFLINLALAGVLALVLGFIYKRYGDSISNRGMFARTFVILIMTTMVIITVVKSSLALSLGLVGALSIVRFRAAIKEPEELAYLFLAIAVGLGLGAEQRVITLISFAVIAVLIIARKKLFHKRYENQNLHLMVSSHNPVKLELNQIMAVLQSCCSSVKMHRFDESKEMLEASFVVTFHDNSDMEKVKEELDKLSDSVKVTFLDYQGTY